jgi:ubiquinone/menaquinone biosynthesis C-methylase UbiE
MWILAARRGRVGSGRSYNPAMGSRAIAPGVPRDYYERIAAVDEHHWWYRGMLAVEFVLLGKRLAQPDQRLLDAGCGTGGFLRYAAETGSFASLAGVDVGSDAIEITRRRVPSARLEVAPLRELPFEDSAFDLVVMHDVLQHVDEREVLLSLAELRRVLAPDGALLVRTNGSRRLRREREDWRAYDRKALVATLEEGGFECERVTYANMPLSVLAALRGRVPHAPTETRSGVPPVDRSALKRAIGSLLLAAEARWLARPRRSLPYGHNLLAVAVVSGRERT